MGRSHIKNILKIGLTGGIASGKSTVCEIFNKLGVPVIDADMIAYELVQKNKPALTAIKEKIGSKYIQENGELNRELLRNKIFTDKTLKQKVESIIHPLVFEEIANKIDELDSPYCIVCVPLLIETGALKSFDRLLVVDLPEHMQIERGSKRDNVNKQSISDILQSQADRNLRLELADDVISNDQDLDKLKPQVENLHNFYTHLANNNKLISAQ